jgi:hypothetical protein
VVAVLLARVLLDLRQFLLMRDQCLHKPAPPREKSVDRARIGLRLGHKTYFARPRFSYNDFKFYSNAVKLLHYPISSACLIKHG